MLIPAKARVCGYCKKRLRTRPVFMGCLLILGGLLLASLIGELLRRPEPPAPPQTTEQKEKAAAAERAAAERAKEEEEIFLQSKAGKIWSAHKGWPRGLCRTIADRQIEMGMTREQVRLAWGKPEHANVTQSAHTTHEQWVYGNGTYVYFVDDKMTTYQETKR